MKVAFICFFMILALSAGLNPKAMATETIKIGQVEPFSGPYGIAGRAQYAGVKFAVDEQNAKGGLLGKRVEIIKADSQLKPDVATQKAKKLILEKKVNFISIGTGSHIAIALNKVATEYKTITINTDALSDILQGREFSRYSFRVCQNSYNSTSALAQLMATKPYKRFYIICQDYPWGHDVAKAFKKQIKKYIPDAEIVGEDYHPFFAKEFGLYIDKVIAAKADAVFSGNWGSDLFYLIRQARDMGLKVPFPFVTVFGGIPSVAQFLKEDAVGIHAAYGYTMRVDTPENKAMIAKYHEQHKNDEDPIIQWPQSYVGQSILGWQMVFAAAEKAGSLDPEKIIESFEGFWYKTPVGWWIMRKCDHQVILPMFGMVIEAGPNPFYDFPWLGPDIVRFPAMESAIPPTRDYNPRCP